ncbi:SPFH domain-containing protein [Alloiococcus sp. CFN-8]|uniref:SPFH domain-containing protein n=1 Tax=Alloiococcus sp. CFN-8 TaxID=3416081 RepID=UPI003CEE4954
MGLIKAGLGALGGSLADQWKEFFYCNALDSDILVAKGEKKVTGRSSNTRGNDNIISRNSAIAVADGQCMIIVEQGKVVELCAEPGEYIYDSSTEPTIFAGNLGQSIKETFKEIGKRFTFGGDPGKDQRVYYFNTKEIVGNKYGTANPVPFRVVDNNIGLDIDISIRCNGEYSYRIVNPMLFYANVCGNVEDIYRRSTIDSMLKSELMTALQPAFARISAIGIRYSAIPGHTSELAGALNEVLSKKWRDMRGIEIASLGVNSVTASQEDENMIKELQRTAVMRNTNMAAATLVGAQADALRAAAKNENGAISGFMGFGMAQQAGGLNAQNLFAMGQDQNNENTRKAETAPVNQDSKEQGSQEKDTWTCSCGAKNNVGKFCMECGAKRPETPKGWSCSCGTLNQGKFCMECGSKKPAEAPLYKCDKCGWKPEDPAHPPKFCPECGDVFDEGDQK